MNYAEMIREELSAFKDLDFLDTLYEGHLKELFEYIQSVGRGQWDAGYYEGYEAGYEDSVTHASENYDTGYEAGFEAGFEDGRNEAEGDYYSGYEAGYQEALDEKK